MQLFRSTIALQRTHRRHLHCTRFHHHFKHSFSVQIHETFRTNTSQVDTNDTQPLITTSSPSQSSLQISGVSHESTFKPTGALAAEVMSGLSALNIKVEGESHTVT